MKIQVFKLTTRDNGATWYGNEVLKMMLNIICGHGEKIILEN